MKKLIVGVIIGVCASTAWQTVTFSQSPAPPQIAFDIMKADVDALLKNAPPAVDQQLRVVDVGKYNIAVGIIHRTATKEKPGDIVIIPPGVVHAWSQITDHVTYLSVRPDPGRVLPGGYVNPLLLRNQPNIAK